VRTARRHDTARSDAGSRGTTLPRVPGVRPARPAGRARAGSGDVRAAGDRDQRTARPDGRCRKGGNDGDTVASLFPTPLPLAAVQSRRGTRRSVGRCALPVDHRSARPPRRVSPDAVGAGRQHGCTGDGLTLRGITLGEVRRALQRVRKEALLGVMNGVPVGISAALVMYVYATVQDAPVSLMLGIVVFVAMTLSCVLSGMIGAGVPLLLRRLGADPATASGILLWTTSDVVSMGLLHSLPAWRVL